MRIDGHEISEAAFAQTLAKVRQAVEKLTARGEESPTQFEVLTAQAFLWFAEERVEYAVVEVGLGGLLDSTNIITPVLSAITNVTLEHADRCGGTLEGVARHKAGIIKAGVPVVTAAQGMPLDVIRQTAAEKGVPLYVRGKDFTSVKRGISAARQQLVFSSKRNSLHDWPYELSLLGEYQIENSAVAVQAFLLLQAMEPRLTLDALRAALAKTIWPGRFEAMDIGRQRIRVDGAHNPGGAAALRTSLDVYFPTTDRVFLLGILRDKDIDAMLAALLRPEDRAVFTTPASERAADPAVLKEKAAAREKRVEPDPAKALDLALEMAGGESLLVVAGSLYLVGGIRKLLQERKGGAL
mgnify:FL=1